ncbi:hypothetical protein ACFV5C_38545, partial [Streptomyces sp. NPDC059762]
RDRVVVGQEMRRARVPTAAQAHPYAHAAPPPAAPPTPRIDQVRAELDELSDLLRKEGEK